MTLLRDTLTGADLAELIRPFVNARLTAERDRNGYVLPREQALDIHTRCAIMCDADVRDVTEQGVWRFFYSGCELVPWKDIKAIEIADLDENGDRIASQRFAPIATASEATIPARRVA